MPDRNAVMVTPGNEIEMEYVILNPAAGSFKPNAMDRLPRFACAETLGSPLMISASLVITLAVVSPATVVYFTTVSCSNTMMVWPGSGLPVNSMVAGIKLVPPTLAVSAPPYETAAEYILLTP